MYKLYGFFTQNSMKPHYVLEALGAEFEFHYVNLLTGENRSESFREKTPIGKVPVLEHDGEYLFESGAICRYVAGVEKSPLYPADKLERARVDQWMTYFSCHPGRWLTEIYFQRLVKPLAGMGETDEDACIRAEKFVRQQFKPLERLFENSSWLANEAFSIADVYALGYLEQMNQIDFSLDEFPRVRDWFGRLEALDSTARVRARVKPYIQAVFGS